VQFAPDFGIMMHDLLTALALILVIEGILPFLRPDGMRLALEQMARLDNRQMRILGLVSMVTGVILLYLIRGYS